MSTRTNALVSQQETGKMTASIIPVAAGCHPACRLAGLPPIVRRAIDRLERDALALSFAPNGCKRSTQLQAQNTSWCVLFGQSLELFHVVLRPRLPHVAFVFRIGLLWAFSTDR